MTTTSAPVSMPLSTASKATDAGSAPSGPRTTSAPTREAQLCSWSAAAARKVSAAPSTTRRPSATSTRASLPTVVVLPVPLTPTTSSTDGLSSCGSALIERSSSGCSSEIRTSRSTARASASVRTLLLAIRDRSAVTTDSVTTGPRSAISRVSSTASQESSSRSPPPSRPSMLRPRVFCDFASRPRRRSSRPSAGAMASISGAAGSTASGAARPRGLARWLGQLNVGDRPLRRVARDGGVIADGGQPAGVDRGSTGGQRCPRLGERDRRRRRVSAGAVDRGGSVGGDRLIRRRRYRTRPTTSAATTRTAMTAIAIHRPSDTTPLSQGG